MKQFISHLLSSLPYLIVFALLAVSPTFSSFAWTNAGVQSALFLFVVILPVIKTKRMSYVDIGWPLGLFLIGVQVLIFTPEFDMAQRHHRCNVFVRWWPDVGDGVDRLAHWRARS